MRHTRLSLAILLLLTSTALAAPDAKLRFWSEQRKGANGDAGHDPAIWFQAAKAVGLQFVRLSPATWPSAGRDFLLGDADRFTRLEPADLKRLLEVLDLAEEHQVKVALTMFSLPGARWRQHNDNEFDYRLWTEERFQQQASLFWRELAQQLKDHPAIVAYNPLNEPHPAREDGFESGQTEGFETWQQQHRGTAADLNRFNQRIVTAIRAVDPRTPILLDGWFHAAPDGLPYLEPVEDERILYSFHFYAPWTYTTYRVNQGRYAYPKAMPVSGSPDARAWTDADLRARLEPVVSWSKHFGIPPNNIVVGEFGCDRRVAGAEHYLAALITLFNEHRWHWAFYSFRSADWDGMDYELGVEKLGWKYWEAREAGKTHEQLIRRHDNPLWELFQQQLAAQR